MTGHQLKRVVFRLDGHPVASRTGSPFRVLIRSLPGRHQITARVTAAAQREPGIYLVTIDGDAQWLFSESVSRTFRPPVRGSSVEIQRGALGSFLMVIDGQQAVRVRRVR